MIIPTNIDLKTWASSLVIDFPEDDVPLLYNDAGWKEWGNFLIQCDSFSKNNAPGTFGYTDWREWARGVFNTMCNFS